MKIKLFYISRCGGTAVENSSSNVVSLTRSRPHDLDLTALTIRGWFDSDRRVTFRSLEVFPMGIRSIQYTCLAVIKATGWSFG